MHAHANMYVRVRVRVRVTASLCAHAHICTLLLAHSKYASGELEFLNANTIVCISLRS